MITSTRTAPRILLVPASDRVFRAFHPDLLHGPHRPEGLSDAFSGAKTGGAESFAPRESLRSFAFTALWMAGFLGGGYLLLWKPLLDRWLF